LSSPLNKLKISHPRYRELVKNYDYLEIQPHASLEQSQYNQHLCVLSDEYKKPLIAGTDTHSLNAYKAECRSILQIAKGIEFSNEDEFDLTYKSYDELVKLFKVQNAIPEKYFMQAIENTNIMADSVEDFELDTSFKYPKLYENSEEVYYKLLEDKLNEKISNGIIPLSQIDAFRKSIEEETSVFKKIDMIGFMLSMSEFVTWCKNNDIPVGFNRGSCGGSREAYITDITDLNPETWKTVFSRFANEDRKEIGDIDIDVAPDDRDKVYDYIINRFTQPYTSFILALGTVSDKGTIDEIGRALARKWEKENLRNEKELKDNKEKLKQAKEYNSRKSLENPYSLSIIAKIKKEYDLDQSVTRDKYKNIFYYFDGLVNTVVSQSMHPAGIVVSPITLPDHYGVFKRDNKIIIQIDMKCIHEVSLVKYDILGLKNIGIIKDAYKLIGKPYPKSHEIDWDDQAVWKDMLRSPVGIK
jgi:DNA polymerase-3 subunit alpha